MSSFVDDFNASAVLNSLLGFNLTEFVEGVVSTVSSFVDDFNASAVFGDNSTSLLKNINFSVLSDKISNLISFIKDINLTSIFGDNLTSFLENLNLTQFNITNFTSLLTGLNLTNSMLNDTVLDNIIKGITSNTTSSIIDLFNRIIGKNNSTLPTNTPNTPNVSNTSKVVVKNSIKSANLNTYYDQTTTFKVTVLSGNKPVTKGKVTFIINNKQHSVNIGSKGVAVLKLKLKPGTYTITSKYASTSVKNKIVIKKSVFVKNVSKKYKKAGKFTVKVLNSEGRVQSKQSVKIKLNGKTYTAKTNSKGIATFNLSKSLKVGKYTIKTTCKGLTLSSKLTVKK